MKVYFYYSVYFLFSTSYTIMNPCNSLQIFGCGELPLLDGETGFGNCHLPAVVGVLDAGDQGAGLRGLPFVERQFDDAGVDGLESQDAFVGFDVPRDHKGPFAPEESGLPFDRDA